MSAEKKENIEFDDDKDPEDLSDTDDLIENPYSGWYEATVEEIQEAKSSK